MDIRIDGNRCRTTGDYDRRLLRALNRLEGMKKWHANRRFSFENTPFNREVWLQVFPHHMVEGAAADETTAADAGGNHALARADTTGRPAFAYLTPPRKHQARAIAKLYPLPAFGLFLDIGCGKSWTAIAVIGRRWCEGLSDHVLLIAKNGVHEQWVIEQLPKHCSVPYSAWVYAKGTKKARAGFDAMMRSEGLKVLAINIDAIDTAAAQRVCLEFMRAAGGRGTVIVDESQDIKSPDSNRTVAALQFGAIAAYRMILTGTPIAKNLVDLFSQFKFLDESIIGHRYLTTYKNHYCDFQSGEFGPVLKGHKNVEELFKRIDPYIFRITKEEALDLPPSNRVQRHFVLSAEQLAAMKQLREGFIADFGGDGRAIVKNAAGLLTRLQQISCGYLPLEDGSVKWFDKNPRLDAALAVLEQTEQKVAIWCRFHQDVEAVTRALGKQAVAYYGPTSDADRLANKLAFMHDASVRYFVATAATGGTGLDGLQHACWFNLYYSNSFNSLDRWQSEGRVERDGTTRSVTHMDLIARKSPDAKILTNLRNKKDIADLTLDEFRLLIEGEDMTSEEMQNE